jgi:ferritin-like metal-binding protein YciE
MSRSQRKTAQYLSEAYAAETGLVRELQAQIAMTPRSSYREALDSHLKETRSHASRVQKRLRELDQHGNPLQLAAGIAESAASQLLAVSRAPLALLRGGTSGEEKLLKNAKDACATEALEIATYTAIEQFAREVGDEPTAALADSIRADEQRMLDRLMRELPQLTHAVVRAEVDGSSRDEIAAEPWPGYDELGVAEIRSALATNGDAKRAGQVRAYERSHKNRVGVIQATERELVGA